MLNNKQIRIGNIIGTGVEFNEETSNIGTVLSIGNDEQEFEQVYCECEESFEWFFKDNYCGVPLNKDRFLDLGFTYHENLIQDSFSYTLVDYKSFDTIVNKDMFHFKQLSLSLCNDRGKGEYYVFIREGDTDKRHEDDIITLNRNYRFVHQVQNLLSDLLIEI